MFDLVEPDLDQALAAEPGFDGVPPVGGALRLSWVRHFSDCFPVVAEEQSQNLLAIADGGLPAAGMVVKKLAGVMTIQGAGALMIELMDGRLEV